MGFGGLFGKKGPSIEEQTVQKIQQANQQIITSQAAANAQASATRPAIAASAADKLAEAIKPPSNAGAKLGILNFIQTSPTGLRNEPKGGRLTLLGN